MKQSKFIYQDNEKFALRAVGIKKNYGKNNVLKGVDLEVNKGERIAILGRNGSGKSTFISLITQQRAFYEGTVVYGYADTKAKALELLGVQFQNLSYPEGFFVKDVLKLFQSAVPLGIRLTKNQLDDLIDLFGIKPYLKQRIDKLSGGQQQRVNIILSLIKRPKLLILDEISSGLDVKSSTDIKNYIKKYLELDKEVSLIIVSHNIEEVRELTKTSYVLKDGLINEKFPSKNLTVDKFMDIISIDIDLVAKNVKLASRIAIVKQVNQEYIDTKTKYTDEIIKKHDRFIHNLDFREVYRIQDELVELKTPEFEVKLTAKIAEKTRINKEKELKEFGQNEKELLKDPLYKKIEANETKLLELNSKEFHDALFLKLEPKHKKDRYELEKDLQGKKDFLKNKIAEHPISALDKMINDLNNELVDLDARKIKNQHPEHAEVTQKILIKMKNHNQDFPMSDNEEAEEIKKAITYAKKNIKKVTQIKKEILRDVATETKKINYDEDHLDSKMNTLIKKDSAGVTSLVKNHVIALKKELKIQKLTISGKEDELAKTKEILEKKYKDQIGKDKELIITILENETSLRVSELFVLEKRLTEEQNGIVEKQHEYSKELFELEHAMPKRVVELEEAKQAQKEKREAKRLAHDKSYENSWTNQVYDYLDKRKKKFNIEPPKKGNILEIRAISKNYKNLIAVDEFSLNIKDGDRIAITGPNGSGKSTVVSMITQLVKPNSGQIAYSFGNTKRSVINNVGVQFQNSSFPQEMTVFDVVIFFARANRYSLTRNEIHDALKVFKLDSLQKRKAYLLSGGEKQRLNVLLALIKKPKLVILDEISTGLDIDSIHKINGYVKEYLDKSKATLIIISHNYEEIYNLANKLVVLSYGEKTEDYDINNWTQAQVKAKMLEIFSRKGEKHYVFNMNQDQFIFNPTFMEIYQLQDDLFDLKSSEFKSDLTNKISHIIKTEQKEAKHDFSLREKEFYNEPLYKKIQVLQTKLLELHSEEFSTSLYEKLKPKHHKNRLELENNLKQKKENLNDYVEKYLIKDLNVTIKKLNKELSKLNSSNNKDEEIAKEITIVENKLEVAKKSQKEIYSNVKKETKEINEAEKNLEAKLNLIIKKDKKELDKITNEQILKLTNELKTKKEDFKEKELAFEKLTKEFNDELKNKFLKNQKQAEIFIKEEIDLRIKRLYVLEEIITKKQKEEIIAKENQLGNSKKNNNFNNFNNFKNFKKKIFKDVTEIKQDKKLPKLNKAISLKIRNFKKLVEDQEEAKFSNKEEKK